MPAFFPGSFFLLLPLIPWDKRITAANTPDFIRYFLFLPGIAGYAIAIGKFHHPNLHRL